jgi:hypothetical protein
VVRRTQIVLDDDLNGGPADETVTFGLDGSWYEIDLNSRNAEQLRHLLATYVESGRRVSTSSGGDGTRVRSSGQNTKVIRDWASEQGLPLPSRGRLPRSIIAAFNDSQEKLN